MMNKTQGPINSKALIAYCRQEPLYKDALDLVRKLYAKDKRSFTGVDYFSHPTTVGSLLLETAVQPTQMAASALEDVLSRNRLKVETLSEKFGAEVLAMVEALTPVKFEFGPLAGATDVKTYGERLQAAGNPVQTIKLASLLDHACAIPRNKVASAFQLFDEVEALLPYLQGGNAELQRRVQVALRSARS